MHPAGHQVVSGPLGGALNQSGGLNLKEALLRKKCPGQGGHPASGHEISLDIRPAQVQVAVFEPQLLLGLAVLLDGEGRRGGLGEDAQILCTHLDGACGQVFIYPAGTGLHPSLHSDNKLASELLSLGEALLAAVALLKDNLEDSGPVAQVHENDSSLVSALLNPPHDGDVLADIRGGYLRASMGSLHSGH